MPGSESPRPRLTSPRALAGIAGALVVAAVVVVLVVVLGSGSLSKKPAGLPAATHRTRFLTIFSDGSQITADPGPEIARLHALGVDIVHVSFSWGQIAPDPTSKTEPRHFDATDPAAYPATGWAVFDTIARDVARDHMRLDLVLAPYPPAWAQSRGIPKESSPPPPDWKPRAALFQQFVEAVGRRYSGRYTPRGAHSPLPRVTMWSIWNEPNSGFLGIAPETVDHNEVEVAPYYYRELADAAWTGLQKTGHGSDTTLIGELAPVGTYIAPGHSNGYEVMPPLRFVRALYCVGSDFKPFTGAAARARGCPATAAGSRRFAADNPVLFHASDFAIHPYPQALPPDRAIPDAPDDAVLAQLPNLFTTLDRVQRAYGSHRQMDAYDTEFGYITSPPATQSGAISPEKAARWINWAEYLSYRMPRLLNYDQFTLDDPFPVPGKKAYTGFATGLRSDVGTPKPGYYAFRMPVWLPSTHAAHGAKLEVWGGVRPAKLEPASRRAPAEIQWRASGRSWRTIATESTRTPDGYFDVKLSFPGSGDVRVRWTPTHGAAMTSRVTPITVG